MIAADTNIIVRLITADDEAEAARARAFVIGNDVFVGTTVLLETAWVLRSRYGYPQRDVATAIRAFGGLPRIRLEAADDVNQALRWAEEGMDIADAFHLSLSRSTGPLATFDQDLLRQARDWNVAVVEP